MKNISKIKTTCSEKMDAPLSSILYLNEDGTIDVATIKMTCRKHTSLNGYDPVCSMSTRHDGVFHLFPCPIAAYDMMTRYFEKDRSLFS